jgi:pSer/pThr/pTyr-binding forkhead associated (FHA) protein
MATHSILALARAYLGDPASVRKKCTQPVLVWEPPRKVDPEAIEITDVSGLDLVGERGEAVAIEVVKGVIPNAFPFGVTIGHAENNDVVLRHSQVSRFHAYVQQANRKRYLVDADSKNGTWLDGRRLGASKPAELPSFATLRFGLLEVTYLEPDHLVTWLAKRLDASPP